MIVSGPGNEEFRNEYKNTQMGKALPYQLVDTGKYDVWLMNVRGNHYSREHLWYDPDTDKEFWNFSFQEFAEGDLKACIDYILQQRNDFKRVTLMGYS